MSKKISILMPAKNTAEYLPECLNSICEQSYQNWELVVVNDHSTDDTFKVLNAFAQKDPRIKPINNIGKGIIEALRLAYSKSEGELITRMDSDDIMTPQKLEALHQKLEEKGRGFLAVGMVEYFSADGMGEGYLKYQDWLNDINRREVSFSQIYKECVIPSPCWMIHREDLDKSGGFLPDTYPEDYDLCFRFYEHGLKVASSKETLHLWRDYPTRSSRTDEHYSDNRFLSLKVNYFLKLDHQKDKELLLWGAGKKGKVIAQKLIESKTNFIWICNNEKKIGKDIYGKRLHGMNHANTIEEKQFLITVAMRNEQEKIKQELTSQNLKEGKDYFFFC